MTVRRVLSAVALLGLVAASSTFGDTISGAFTGSVTGVGLTVTVNGGNHGFNVGALTHTWTGGNGLLAGHNGTYGTFCLDLQHVSSTNQLFTLCDVTAAPVLNGGNAGNPGSSYSVVQAYRLDAVVRALVSLNYLDGKGAFISGGGASRAAAIQLAVWESIWEPTAGAGWDLTGGTFLVSSLPAGVSTEFNTIISNTTYVGSGARIVSALCSANGQDQLTIVPLPPAAWAGMGSLAGVMAIGFVRRRRHFS